MNESAALDIITVRAIESADRERSVWSDADRAWASRAAAEVVGEAAPAGVFLARRAEFALERLGERDRALPRAIRSLRWRPWVGYAILAGALILGVAVDRVGAPQRINVLAPPVLVLLLWNLAVYAAIMTGYIVRYGETRDAGPLRSIVMRLASGARWLGARPGGSFAASVATFTTDWIRAAASLYGARAARILHLAAVALALGVIAGLYLRGIAFEYRATWESTFLDAPTVRTLLAIALAPGAAISGMPVPDVAQLAAIRAPASENAARWLHLLAATLLVVVVLPRLVLALFAGLLERHRAARLPLAVDEPYFQRLLRGLHAGPARVCVVPYSYTPPPATIAGLEAVLARVLGGNVTLTTAQAVGYGDEDELPTDWVPAAPGPIVALFNLAATPEREAHGAFVAAVAARAGSGRPLLAVVDETAFRERWGDSDPRLEERRAAWRDVLAGPRIAPAFVHLAGGDLPAAEAALDAALARAET